ncbi:MAG: DUF2971 domain-containing protein [Candidatus Omnitrophica bacterium]|jgi:hypothetical protein|nr:DUF2971 domain-containing protein [Candidatus Omnitrophota bacterium]
MSEKSDLTVQEVLGNTALTDKIQVLYHYTSMDSLEKIMKNECMHFSHISWMNDYSEYDWGLNMFQEKLLKMVSDKTKEMEESFKKFINIIKKDKDKDNPCVGSFTALKESLSQWRGYGDKGGGICIGFDAGLMKRICKENNFIIGDVLYGDSFDGSCSNFLAKISGFISAYTNDPADALARVGMLISLLACFVKHEGFQEEKEIRIAIPFPEKLPNKLKGKLYVPYFLFDFKENFSSIFKEIWVGPAANQELLAKSVSLLINECGLDDSCKIYKSNIPYRII